MSLATLSLSHLKDFYESAERAYFDSLPLEHFMEAGDHSHQRKITFASFDVIREVRPEIQLFSEMLVQYPSGIQGSRPRQVVPDNFVTVYHEPLEVDGSFNTPLQPVGPFMVMEYVSRHTERKDYVDNHSKYERELKVPYYLLFYPHNQQLSVYRMVDDRYLAVKPNDLGRLEIPELELEVAVLDHWVRYWFRGTLVPLTGELLKSLNLTTNQLRAAKDQLEAQQEQLNVERQARADIEAELAHMRIELDRLRGEQS